MSLPLVQGHASTRCTLAQIRCKHSLHRQPACTPQRLSTTQFATGFGGILRDRQLSGHSAHSRASRKRFTAFVGPPQNESAFDEYEPDPGLENEVQDRRRDRGSRRRGRLDRVDDDDDYEQPESTLEEDQYEADADYEDEDESEYEQPETRLEEEDQYEDDADYEDEDESEYEQPESTLEEDQYEDDADYEDEDELAYGDEYEREYQPHYENVYELVHDDDHTDELRKVAMDDSFWHGLGISLSDEEEDDDDYDDDDGDGDGDEEDNDDEQFVSDEESESDEDSNADDEEEEEFQERVIQVRRVTKVATGGKQMSFRAVVVVGDEGGTVGVGCAASKEIVVAVTKAVDKAKNSLVNVSLTKANSFPHRMDGYFGAAKVMLRPASEGTGVIAGGAVRVVLELAGIKNGFGKQLQSQSPLNNARATIAGLYAMESLKDTAKLRGMPLQEYLAPRKNVASQAEAQIIEDMSEEELPSDAEEVDPEADDSSVEISMRAQ